MSDEFPEPLRQQVALAFSPTVADSLWARLLERLGPILAELLLKWLLKQRVESSAPERILVSSDALWHWVLHLIVSHRDEIIALLKDQVEVLFDLIVASLKD